MFITNLYSNLRRRLYDHPTIFFSYIMGIGGPVLLLVGYPIRREMGYKAPVDAPRTFPIPSGPRKSPAGYDD